MKDFEQRKAVWAVPALKGPQRVRARAQTVSLRTPGWFCAVFPKTLNSQIEHRSL